MIPAGALETEPRPEPASATVNVKVGTAVPLPLSCTVCELPLIPSELSVNVRPPLSAPLVDGVKITETVQLEFAANWPPAVLHVSPGPSLKSLAFVPVKA